MRFPHAALKLRNPHPRRQSRPVFSDSASNAFAPKPKATGLKLCSHRANNVRFAETRFFADFIKGSAVFPSHANDGRDLGCDSRIDNHAPNFGAAGVK